MLKFARGYRNLLLALLAGLLLAACASSRSIDTQDPLPSWNDGPSRQAILEFVREVSREGGEYYVAPSERIAVFDNDGTLWAEKPIYKWRRAAARNDRSPYRC